MLNEGYTLYESLVRCDIPPPKRHPDIKKAGKKKGLIVGIDNQGIVASIEFRNQIEMSKLWKISDGKKNNFPCMTLSLCLLNIDAYYKDINASIKNNADINFLNNIWKQYGLNQISKKRNGKEIIQPMFSDWQSTIVKLIERKKDVENIEEGAEAYKILLERVLKLNYEKSDREIATEITEKIFINLNSGILILDDIKDFLVKKTPNTFIFFDVADYYKFKNRVAGSKIVYYISDCLLKKTEIQKPVLPTKQQQPSALTGKPISKIPDKFPDPHLQIMVAQLFGVDKNTPCLKRYGRISTKLFPVDIEESNAIQDALVWITNEERRGKTWYAIPGISDDKIDLLLVYLESKPDLNINKAHLLGGISKNDFSESTYEAVSGVAIKALKAEKVDKANELIRIFAIHEADKMRRQISLQRTYSVANLIKADEEWQVAAKNLPKISLPFFRKEIERITAKQKEPTQIIKSFLDDDRLGMIALNPNCIFPGDLVRLTQKQWVRGEKEYSLVPGCSLCDVYDIFFAEVNERKYLTKNLLSKTFQCTKTMLFDLGNADHKKEIKTDMKKYSREKRFTALKAFTAFAIYLHKLEITKENYMKDTFFYIGKFLSLIDTLHFEWCKCVRGGYPEKEEKEWRKAIPPQLLGNSHFQIALDNPASAFSILSRRITNPYLSWTKKEYGEHMKSAKWASREIGQISDLLSQKEIPRSTTDVEKVQILLGYLARSESRE